MPGVIMSVPVNPKTMSPPRFQPGQQVVSLLTGPGLTIEGFPCEVKRGSIYIVFQNQLEDRGWVCWLEGLDMWEEKYFEPIVYASEEALAELLEESFTLQPF